MRNPFTPGFGQRPNVLGGASELLASMNAAMESGPRDPAFTRLLLGPRGSGKTILLAEIGEAAAQAGCLVVSTDASTGQLPERLAARISALRSNVDLLKGGDGTRRLAGITVGPVGLRWETLPKPHEEWDLQQHLLSLAEWAAHQGTTILLTVDELQAGVRSEIRRLSADIQAVTKIAALPLSFIGAGLPEMAYTILRDRKMTFLHRCVTDHIPPLSFSVAWRCLRETIEGGTGSVRSTAVTSLARAVTSGLPYHLQSLGHHAWELAGAPSSEIDESVVDVAVELAVEDMKRKVLTPMWHDLADGDRDYVDALLANGGEAARQQIGAAIRPRRTNRQLLGVEDRLLAAGHIQETDQGTLKLVGPLRDARHLRNEQRSRGYGQDDAGSEDDSSDSSTTRGQATLCGKWMPRAQATCILRSGHSGRCRSKL